jgi:3-oxoadipate enol-lactonase
MPTARVGDLDIVYERAGSGPPVLVIGGTGGDLRQRPGLLDTPLIRAFEVVVYDQRGMGRTTVPDGPYSMAGYADDAAGLIAEVGWDRCAVVGISFGGMVAQELALRHPGLVERLVLACTSSGGAGGSSYPLHELAARPEDERDRRQLALSDTRVGEEWQATHPDDTEALLELVRARRQVGAGEPGREKGAALQFEARATHDTWDRLGSITAPTLVCAGRYDAIAPVENNEALVERIPDARLEVFEGGHLFLMQDRRAWSAIAGFLAP